MSSSLRAGPIVVALSVVCSTGAAVLWGPAQRASDSADVMQLPVLVAIVVGAVVLSSLGALIVRHQPRNSIGWTFLVAGGGMGVINLIDQIVFLSYAPGQTPMPGAAAALWIHTWLAIPVIWLPVFAVLLLFPDGRFLSRRWRWLGWVVAVTIGGQTLAALLVPGPMFGEVLSGAPDNPLGVDALSGVITAAGSAFWIVLSVALAFAAASMVLRFRRATGVERQQLKWIAYSAAFVVAGIAGQMLLYIALSVSHPVLDIVVAGLIVLGLASLPLCTTVAIMRYRLWDIDRLVNRTLVYGGVTVVLAAAYTGSVVGLQALLPTRGSDLAVAASTLAVVAVFRPLRRRVGSIVERRFDRSRYDAARTVEEFSQRMRDQVDPEAVGGELEEVAQVVLRPASVGIWTPAVPARRT